MGKNDVAEALKAMITDADVAERLAAGDFTALPEAELTEAEQAMVRAAADDIPDVSGFAVFAKYDGVDGESKERYFPKVEIDVTASLKIAGQYSGFNFEKIDW